MAETYTLVSKGNNYSNSWEMNSFSQIFENDETIYFSSEWNDNNVRSTENDAKMYWEF